MIGAQRPQYGDPARPGPAPRPRARRPARGAGAAGGSPTHPRPGPAGDRRGPRTKASAPARTAGIRAPSDQAGRGLRLRPRSSSSQSRPRPPGSTPPGHRPSPRERHRPEKGIDPLEFGSSPDQPATIHPLDCTAETIKALAQKTRRQQPAEVLMNTPATAGHCAVLAPVVSRSCNTEPGHNLGRSAVADMERALPGNGRAVGGRLCGGVGS